MEANKFILLFFCIFYFSIFPTLEGSPTLEGRLEQLDRVWQIRALEAKKAASKAFKPNPAEITADFNEHVNKAFKESNTTRDTTSDTTSNTRSNTRSNTTRRGLAKKYTGPCMVTNPIDKCWRCDPNWANNRKKLANCALGFARGTTGGKNGKLYVVTNPNDNDMVNPKPGTLRHAVIQKEPLWIIFARSMNIKLNAELILTDNKTIDARGANVHISNGAQITIQYVNNIIIHGLHIHDIRKANGGLIRDSTSHYGLRAMSDGDGIVVYGSTNIWLDHLSMTRCEDGLIDVIQGSTAITISNCHFANHNDVMLFGASASFTGDKIMQVTLAFNHFGKGLVQRMPRCRYGFFHIVNNDYTHWLMYAIGGSQEPTIVSQGNRFIAPHNPFAKEVTKRDYTAQSVWKNWNWRSEGDLFMNGAFFVQSGKKVLNMPNNGIKPKHGKYVSSLTRFSGPIKCIPNKPC